MKIEEEEKIFRTVKGCQSSVSYVIKDIIQLAVAMFIKLLLSLKASEYYAKQNIYFYDLTYIFTIFRAFLSLSD